MELQELIRYRRSIRKYQGSKIEREKLEKIVEAGIFAPNPGGRQEPRIVVIEDAELIEKIGIVNADCEDRSRGGHGPSAEQPSILDDQSIKSGFYGCTALAVIFVPNNMAVKVNGIGSAFVCAENMVLQACELGVSSCIVGRAEASFSRPETAPLLEKWGMKDGYVPLAFVCMGYVRGAYPDVKARKEGRVIWDCDT